MFFSTCRPVGVEGGAGGSHCGGHETEACGCAAVTAQLQRKQRDECRQAETRKLRVPPADTDIHHGDRGSTGHAQVGEGEDDSGQQQECRQEGRLGLAQRRIRIHSLSLLGIHE